jgi:hypothetical protein
MLGVWVLDFPGRSQLAVVMAVERMDYTYTKLVVRSTFRRYPEVGMPIRE